MLEEVETFEPIETIADVAIEWFERFGSDDRDFEFELPMPRRVSPKPDM